MTETISKDLLGELLESLSHDIEQENQRRDARAQKEAPEFDAFVYLRQNENTLSRMVADLVDPRGSHGQRSLFLSLFLDAFGLRELKELDRANVKLECQTLALNARRRIDVVIRGKDWVVGIENKPVATDQRRQVTDYLLDLQQRGARLWHLIYLTKDGARPDIESIGETACTEAIEARRLCLGSYQQIAQWLHECRKRCHSDRVGWYLEMFESYVNRSLLGHASQEIETMIQRTLLDEMSAAHRSAAFELLQARDAIRDELKRRTTRAVEKRLSGAWRVEHRLEDDSLLLAPSSEAGWLFGVEREGSRWFYGIKLDDEIGTDSTRAVQWAAERLASRLPPSGRPNKYWAYWRWFEGVEDHEPREYDNWEKNIRPWEDMASGVMVDHIVALATRLRSLMEGASE